MNNLNDIFFAPAANQELTYDQVLEYVQRYFAENHASTIAEAGEANAERATSLLKELMVQYIVKRKYAISGLTTEHLCEQLYEDMAGYSFLKKWIYKPGIEEVNLNAYNDIEVIEAGGRSIKIPDKFSSPQHAIDVVRRRDRCACGGRNKLVHAELLHDKPRHAHANACAEDGKQTRQAGDQKDLPCFHAACKQVGRPDVQHPDKQRTNRKNHQQNAEKNGGTMITNEKPSSRLVRTNF